MKKAYLTILAFAATLPIMAQMTLRDCLIYARDHAHSNRISRLDIRKAEIERTAALSGLLPQLAFAANGNLGFGRNIDPETNTYDNRRTLSTSFGINLSIPLFDGLVSVFNLKAAKVAALRQASASKTEEDQVSISVIRAFYNVSYCKAMLEQTESQLRRDSTDLSATRRAEALGTKSGADVAEMEAIVASDLYEHTNQRNLLLKAYLELKGLMGMEPTPEPIEIQETPEAPAIASLYKHPRLQEAEYALEQSRINLKAAKGAFFPMISLNGGISTSYYRMMGTETSFPGFRSQWRDNMGQYLGLSFSLPLFTGLTSTSRLKKAEAELRQSREKLEQVRFDLEKETEGARLDHRAAADELEAARRRVAAEESAYKAIRRKYELGMASAIDLYTSSAKLSQAKAGLEGKRIQHIISGIMLRYCLGAPLID